MDILKSLEAFIAVATVHSVSEAGHSLNLTPSAVSKQLSALEHHLGATLISRTTHGLNLTSAGQNFLPRAIAVVDELSRALNDVQDSARRPRGILNVAAPAAFGRMHVAPAIPNYMRSYPDVRVNLGLFDRQVDPTSSAVDVSFRMGHLPDSSTIAAKLATTRRILCASPDYIARHGPPRTPADLANHACLIHTLYTARNVWYFRRRGELRAVLVKGSLAANNSEALLAAALQGLGIALLGSWAVPKEIADGALVPLLPDWQGDLAREQRHLYLTYPRSARASLLTRTFVEYFRVYIGAPPYWERPK